MAHFVCDSSNNWRPVIDLAIETRHSAKEEDEEEEKEEEEEP